MLQQIIRAGAIGTELVLSGKLPSDRARSWRFAQGYLKKTGDPAKLVDTAQAQAVTISGVVGIKVSILHPKANLKDHINVDEEMRKKIRVTYEELTNPEQVIEEEPKKEKKAKKADTKKTTKKKPKGEKK